MDWDSPNRWSSVDLALLKPDWCFFKNHISSRSDLSLCSLTLSNSFITELIRLMGRKVVVREGSLSGFSDIRRVAIFHAVGMKLSWMEEVKSLGKRWNNEVVVPSLSTSLCMLSGPGALPLLRNLTNLMSD